MNLTRHQASNLARTLRGLAILLALGIASSGAFVSPAGAVEAPQAHQDYFSANNRDGIVGNVLANDAHDPLTTIALVDVRVNAGTHWYSPYAGALDAPTVSWTPAGEVTVDFGPYTHPDYPSLSRQALLVYTMEDSLGQRSESTITVFDSNPGSPLIAVDDAMNGSGMITLGNTDWRWISGLELRNDTYGPVGLTGHPSSALRVEIVDQPSHFAARVSSHRIEVQPTADFVSVARDATEDSLAYRLCNDDGCSNVATVSFSMRVEAPVPEIVTTFSSWVFWDGGPTENLIDLRSTLGADDTSFDLTGLTPRVAASSPLDRGWTRFELDATTATLTSTWVDATTDRAKEDLLVEWVDGDGALAARTWLTAAYAAPTSFEDAEFGPNEGWVATGSQTVILTGENDRYLPADPLPFGAKWVGVNTSDGPPDAWRTVIDGGDLAAEFRWTDVRDFDALVYRAGERAGNDHLIVRRCHWYPNPTLRECLDEEVTVYVSPRISAEDDEAVTPAGDPVEVDVTSNDVFTDVTGSAAPDPATATVTLIEVPAKVTARVNPDRSVIVQGPQSMAGQTVTLTYRLRDFTGTATAKVKVRMTGEAVTPPTARDDEATGRAGNAIRVTVLANDTFKTPGKVAIVTGSLPAGVKARVDAHNRVVVTVPTRLAGQRVTGRYRLSDGSGSDTARFVVTTLGTAETGSAIRTVDARESATESTRGGDGTWFLAAGGLAAAACLAGAGLFVGRRKVRS